MHSLQTFMERQAVQLQGMLTVHTSCVAPTARTQTQALYQFITMQRRPQHPLRQTGHYNPQRTDLAATPTTELSLR